MMTPARKAALEWFHEIGEANWRQVADGRACGPLTYRLSNLIAKDSHLELDDGWNKFSLTDKGRRDLHESGR